MAYPPPPQIKGRGRRSSLNNVEKQSTNHNTKWILNTPNVCELVFKNCFIALCNYTITEDLGVLNSFVINFVVGSCIIKFHIVGSIPIPGSRCHQFRGWWNRYRESVSKVNSDRQFDTEEIIEDRESILELRIKNSFWNQEPIAYSRIGNQYANKNCFKLNSLISYEYKILYIPP